MGANFVVQDLFASDEFKEDSVAVIYRIGPKVFKTCFELVCLETWLKGVLSE